MDTVKVINVIFCDKLRRGKGVESDPVRCVTEIFDFGGNLIAENDPEKIYTQKDLAGFALFVANSDWKNIPIADLLKRYTDDSPW